MKFLLPFLLLTVSFIASSATKGTETVMLLKSISKALVEEGYSSMEANRITRDLLHDKSLDSLLDLGIEESVAKGLAKRILLAENADKCATDPSESKKGTPNHTKNRKTGKVSCTVPGRKSDKQYSANKAAAKATRDKQAKADKKNDPNNGRTGGGQR